MCRLSFSCKRFLLLVASICGRVSRKIRTQVSHLWADILSPPGDSSVLSLVCRGSSSCSAVITACLCSGFVIPVLQSLTCVKDGVVRGGDTCASKRLAMGRLRTRPLCMEWARVTCIVERKAIFDPCGLPSQVKLLRQVHRARLSKLGLRLGLEDISSLRLQSSLLTINRSNFV